MMPLLGTAMWFAVAPPVEESCARRRGDAEDYAKAGHYWYVDARKARRELGFEPRPLEETLRDTVNDLRAQHDDLHTPTWWSGSVRRVRRWLEPTSAAQSR